MDLWMLGLNMNLCYFVKKLFTENKINFVKKIRVNYVFGPIKFGPFKFNPYLILIVLLVPKINFCIQY